jgi:hypothetical protein
MPCYVWRWILTFAGLSLPQKSGKRLGLSQYQQVARTPKPFQLAPLQCLSVSPCVSLIPWPFLFSVEPSGAVWSVKPRGVDWCSSRNINTCGVDLPNHTDVLPVFPLILAARLPILARFDS